MWGNDCLTGPELFGERSNNSLTLQGGASNRPRKQSPTIAVLYLKLIRNSPTISYAI
jgi:hypothetical protein